jgi:hypothetical protein
MRLGPAPEMMAADHSGEALSFARPADMHFLSNLEDVYEELITLFGLAFEPEFPEKADDGRPGFLEMALAGLGRTLGSSRLDEPELQRFVAVPILGLLLNDRARSSLNNGQGNGVPGLVEALGHADFFADQT